MYQHNIWWQIDLDQVRWAKEAAQIEAAQDIDASAPGYTPGLSKQVYQQPKRK